MNRLEYIICFLLLSCISLAQTPNSWTQVADLGGCIREFAVSFNIDSFGYVGLGAIPDTINGGFVGLTDLWQYNPHTNTWTQKASFPGPIRGNPISFVVSSKAYIGLGVIDGTTSPCNDLWEYDPATDAWTQKANFPPGRRASAIGFSIRSKGYVGLGATLYSDDTTDFWQYDPTADAWTPKAAFAGGPRTNAIGFSIGGYGYVGLGEQFTFGYHDMNDFWQYDTLTDSWSQKANYPGVSVIIPFSFVIADRGYIGAGVDSEDIYHNSFWEYNSSTDQWVGKDSFGGGLRASAVGFSIGNKGYAGTGDYPNEGFTYNDFWMYTPVSIFPDPASDKLYINTSLKNISVSIADMAGQSWPVFLSGSEINVSTLPAGVYCLRIQDSSGSVVRKFVKE